VLKRILTYIRRLPCSFFPKKSDPYLYDPIVAVGLSAFISALSVTVTLERLALYTPSRDITDISTQGGGGDGGGGY
jgi:hypothetical protein